MTHVLELDIETYSGVELRESNVYAYVEDPTFEVLMCGWSLDDSPVEVVEGEDRIDRIPGLWDPEVKKIAHGAQFERVCFSRMRGLPVGEYLPPEDWFDTMSVAREHGLPASLDMLAKALGADLKDSAGTRLINLFCKPHRLTRKGPLRRVMPHERPEKWAEFVEYCRQDVVTLKDVRSRMPGWPSAFERELWYVDQRVNDRGLKVDLGMARKAVEAAEANTAAAAREVIEITGVENPGSTQQLAKWAEGVGLVMPDWTKDTVAAALAKAEDPSVARVLELRQDLALVASRKYAAALRGVSADGRLRGQFTFHGAHTGRWSSRGVQVHNLPRKAFVMEDPETGKEIQDLATQRAAIMDLMFDLGCSPDNLKKLVRPLFVSPAADPRDPLDDPFAISDFSAIEARVLAWLAGEQWVLDAFEAGRDIYVETAERMGGGLTRQQGKVAVLALGYQGAVGSLRVMGGKGTDEELQDLVNKWRRANPRIVRFWKRLEQAFRSEHGGRVGRITVEAKGSTRRVRLPSGRAITYRGVRTGQRCSYMHVRGYREDTYGGRLTENVTQAVARDLLADAMIRLDRAGYPIVSHVHDEVVVESKDIDGITAVMRVGPDWADGLPLDASGDITERYTK
jgi:DNA polymerase